MRQVEARDLTRATAGAARGVAGIVESTHDATTGIVYGALRRILGPAVVPVREIHRVIGRASFGGIHLGLRAGGAAAELAVAAVNPLVEDPADARDSLLDRRGPGFALGVLNGVAGDRLAREESTLALAMTLRHEDRDLPVTTEALRAAYGMGRRRLVVFVHGLVESDRSWAFRARQRWGEEGVTYGRLLERDEGWLPIYLRYNTGLPIAANAQRLGDLLTALLEAWPDPVEELALVGHSMGGLVAVTALAHDERPWTRVVRAVVTLGSPRDGAPLERFAAVLEEFTKRTGWARWFGGLVGIRSSGIRDLHDPLTHPPIPDRIEEYAVLATLTPGSWHPQVPRVGDGLVPLPERHHCESAVVHGVHHLDLLDHPDVYPLLRGWLAARG